MRKLFCFDMDMTLLDHGTMKIPDSALRALKALREKGHLIAITSGRDMDSPFSKAYGEVIKPDAVVHSNGQKVTVGGKKLREIFMERELVGQLIAFGRERKICIGSNVGEVGAFVHPEVIRHREERLFGSCERSFVPAEELLEHDLYALVLFGKDSSETPAKAREVEDAFPQLKCALFSRNEGADVVYRNTSKAEGIRCLLDYFGLSFEDTVAFGDSMNDMEMICSAGVGVAMGNAIPSLKEAADFVTRPVWEDGVAYALKKLGLV